MNRRRGTFFLACVVSLLAVSAACWLLWGRSIPDTWVAVERTPRIWPDYVDTVIPPNIAPLNFAIQEPGVAYRVRLHAANSEDIDIASTSPSIVIPQRAWRTLLEENRGGRLGMDVYVQQPSGSWSRFATIENVIAQEDIDSHLAYRLLGAVFVNWGHIGIYQRELQSYDEQPILRNASFENGCVNCHAFSGGRPENFSLHVRPPSKKPFAGGMIAGHGGQVRRIVSRSKAVPTLPTYTAWHPNAPLAAVSLTRSEQFMHGGGKEVREVYDRTSDLALVNVNTGEVASTREISDPDRLETFPCWSADGQYLYFCSAPARDLDPSLPPFVGCETVRYDLMRIRYDVDTNAWGPLQGVLTAEQTGLSISEPRISPDGRFLLFCMADHGAFPVLQADCDLYLMDLTKGDRFPFRPLAKANSPSADSWHCWSSNSRWIVFSSKRGNGLFARPQFCYIDQEGNEHKPFVLPQQDPLFYDSYLKTYNVPELLRGPVRVKEEQLVQAILSTATATADDKARTDYAAPN